MRVVTIDGGFRGLGLGDLGRAKTSAVDDFTRRISLFDETWERFSALRGAGEISSADDAILTREYEAFARAVAAHMAAAERLTTEAQVAAWRAESENVLRETSLWVRRVRYVIDDGEKNRTLRIALIAAASITVFGGGMYIIYRATKNRRRGRR